MNSNWPPLTPQQMVSEAWLLIFCHWTHSCDAIVVKSTLSCSFWSMQPKMGGLPNWNTHWGSLIQGAYGNATLPYFPEPWRWPRTKPICQLQGRKQWSFTYPESEACLNPENLLVLSFWSLIWYWWINHKVYALSQCSNETIVTSRKTN